MACGPIEFNHGSIKQLKFVILNDTRDQPHFGCQRVMRTIYRLLENRGAVVIGTALAGTNWTRDERFLNALRECDAILINGEGTLHHGHARAERMLQVVDHPFRAGKPVSIVNALYQANPQNWSKYLNKVQLVIARDGNSYQELAGVYSGNLIRALDLSFHEPVPEPSKTYVRVGMTFGDSVYPEVTRQLLTLSKSLEGTSFLPIMHTIKSRKAGLSPVLRKLRDTYIYLHSLAYQRIHRNVHFSKNEVEFFELIGHSRGHITGRFHGACLSVLAGTPFLAVDSNSWKIDALLDDLGLSQTRKVEMKNLLIQKWDAIMVPAYSSDEQSRMWTAIEASRRTVEQAFDHIAVRQS